MNSSHSGNWPGESDLMDAGIRNVGTAAKAIEDLAGNGVTDDDLEPLIPLLLAALRESPDPDRALQSFARWFAAVGNPCSHLQTLLNHPIALELFCLITGCSQYFADLLVRNPEYFEIIANHGIRGGTKTLTRYQREAAELVSACIRPELKRDALRRWKAREMLRIGVRDLAGLADMPSTAREFSNLADACVQEALSIAYATVPAIREPATDKFILSGEPEPSRGDHVEVSGSAFPGGFSVIAMGKLGGQELNYSSDIDLMFVHADQLPTELELENGRTIDAREWLTRLGEALIKGLSEETTNGHVFRVDMRLRPEGRFGSLVRSLASYRTYYETWAESWERQALVKARPIAGDPALGVSFMEIVTPFVYRQQISAEFVDDVRTNKRRVGQKCAIEGEVETNVKLGYGGIRDIEFIVQLFQLEMGGRIAQLRTPNTLAGLRRLHQIGALTALEESELADDYQFLRTLEHRLQLLHSFHTQVMPPASDDRERTFLARRMGFATRADFESALARRRTRVHTYLDLLFYEDRSGRVERAAGPESEWADVVRLLDNLDSEAAVEHLASRLRVAGFRDIPASLRALTLPMSGNEFGRMPPDTPEEFKNIAPRLLALLAASPQPDQGLAGLEGLAFAVPNRAQLYASMDDSPQMTARLVSLASASPPLMQRLIQRLEWMEGLVAEEEVVGEGDQVQIGAGGNPYGSELVDRLEATSGHEEKLKAIARYYLRETLRIGARDIWNLDEPTDTMRSLTRLSEKVLGGLLAVSTESILASETDADFASSALQQVAALGLGKFGGEELGYASDWDLVFVYGEEFPGRGRRGSERSRLAQRLVEGVIGAVKLLATYGAGIEVDLRLRPWGKKGSLVLTPQAYLDYFTVSGETWERQAALKARFVAGSATVGRQMEEIFRTISLGDAAEPHQLDRIVAMKRRIEKERLKATERQTDLKLGHGGLSDIEWLVQKLSMEHAESIGSMHVTNTLQALAALSAARILPAEEARALSESYSQLTRVRNGLWLLTGQSHDVLSEGADRRALALRFGYRDEDGAPAEQRLWMDLCVRMSATRRIFNRAFNGSQS